jgi:hypothetical protein
MACRYFSDGPYCVGKCPLVRYPDSKGVCQLCAQYCADGCTGPSDRTVKGGCNSCHFGLIEDRKDYIAKCINPQIAESEFPVCPDAYYKSSVPKGPMKNKDVRVVLFLSDLVLFC